MKILRGKVYCGTPNASDVYSSVERDRVFRLASLGVRFSLWIISENPPMAEVSLKLGVE